VPGLLTPYLRKCEYNLFAYYIVAVVVPSVEDLVYSDSSLNCLLGTVASKFKGRIFFLALFMGVLRI